MRGETWQGASRPAESDGVVGAIVFVVVSLLLIATASLAPASHAASGPHGGVPVATERARP